MTITVAFGVFGRAAARSPPSRPPAGGRRTGVVGRIRADDRNASVARSILVARSESPIALIEAAVALHGRAIGLFDARRARWAHWASSPRPAPSRPWPVQRMRNPSRRAVPYARWRRHVDAAASAAADIGRHGSGLRAAASASAGTPRRVGLGGGRDVGCAGFGLARARAGRRRSGRHRAAAVSGHGAGVSGCGIGGSTGMSISPSPDQRPDSPAVAPRARLCYRAARNRRTDDRRAGVAELVDAAGLGPAIARCGGSSPFARTSSSHVFARSSGRLHRFNQV